MSSIRRIPIDSVGDDLPAVISPKELSALLRLSVKTVYQWIAMGRLDGCIRRRGKHVLIVRSRALDRIFNGPEWS